MQRKWAQEASEKLFSGQTARTNAKGHSMQDRMSDGDTVTLERCEAQRLAVGGIVLCRIEGRRYSHLVLHLVVFREAAKFLIGNNHGRIDGWVSEADILGKATKVESQETMAK